MCLELAWSEEGACEIGEIVGCNWFLDGVGTADCISSAVGGVGVVIVPEAFVEQV